MKIGYIILFSTILFCSCDNKEQIENFQKDSSSETENLEKTRHEYENSLDSLKNEVMNISKSKSEIEKSQKYSETVIYDILNNAYFDHLIIGVDNLTKLHSFLRDTLGFNIKNGKFHNNGISNSFIEFSDSSEIEFVSVTDPNDKLAKYYNSQIVKNNYGIRFAMRTNQIKKLSEHLKKLDADFSEITSNKSYSTLSKSNYDTFPLFFIEYQNNNFNKLINHENGATGITHIWLATKQLKETLLKFVDYGFSIIDTLKMGDLKSNAVLIKNKNFKIILIESSINRVEGVSIKLRNLDKMKVRLDNRNLNYEEIINKEGIKSVRLSPKVSKSIWIEFYNQ